MRPRWLTAPHGCHVVDPALHFPTSRTGSPRAATNKPGVLFQDRENETSSPGPSSGLHCDIRLIIPVEARSLEPIINLSGPGCRMASLCWFKPPRSMTRAQPWMDGEQNCTL